MSTRRKRAGVAVGVLAMLAAGAFAQRGRGRFQSLADAPAYGGDADFHFLRLAFSDYSGFSRFGFASRRGIGRGWWVVDFPDADDNFTTGIRRLTRIDTGEPRHLEIMDDRLFDYPWLYATNVGYWDLNDEEAARLREYLFRGGFLVFDDFWGQQEWETFRQAIEKVLPNRPITDIVETDPVMNVLYAIREKDRTFIPGSRHLWRGAGGSVQIVQPQGTAPAWRSMYDDRNHTVVAINYDTDVGDAWEFADVPYYPEAMTALAYRYGINYIIYSMTH